MHATNKAEAIEELTDLLQKDGAISCRETFIQDVWQRESEGSTGFENHIAIPMESHPPLLIPPWHWPHPAGYCLGNAGRQPGTLHYFICRSSGRSKYHPYRLLSQVAGALADDDIIEQLLKETSPQRIIDLFNQYAESDIY
jgi:PTS system fructose-specific IIA component